MWLVCDVGWVVGWVTTRLLWWRIVGRGTAGIGEVMEDSWVALKVS